MKKALLLFAALALASAAAGAGDWPQWRGPQGTGIASDTGLPERWTKDGFAWQSPLGGEGVSSPIVSGDAVFVTSQAGRGELRPGNHPKLASGDDAAAEKPLEAKDAMGGEVSFLVEAFDAKTGRRLWEHKMKADGPLAAVHQKHNLASPSPVTDGERVYAWFGTGQIVALSMDGKLVWQRHLGKEISPFDIQWGHGSSPVLHRDLLILQCDHVPASYLLAVDKRTGKERWRTERGQGVLSYGTPVVVPGPSGPEMIVNGSERLDAYDPDTGKHLWFTGDSNRFPIPVASFHDGLVYTSRGYRSGPYMAIRPGGRGDITKTHVEWLVPTGAPYVPSLVKYEGLLYMVNDAGVAIAADAKSGEKVWQERIGGVYTASPVAGDGKVYFVNEASEIVVVKPGRAPRVLARNPVPGRLVASPAIAHGRLYVRNDSHLVSIGGKP